MEENKSEKDFIEKDFIVKDFIVTLDASGKQKFKTFASTLRSSCYFRNMLGEYGKSSKKQEDGSYFIDCEPETLSIILEVLRYF